MGSDRQHYIPRFLLKGFNSRFHKGQYFAYVYRKESKPFETNIINIGVSKGFYTQEGDNQADEIITSLETGFAKYIDELREFDTDQNIPSNKISKFVAHLELRNRYIRESLLDLSGDIVSKSIDFFAGGNDLKQLCRDEFKKDPSILEDKLKQIPQYSQLNRQQKQLFLDQALKNAVELVDNLADVFIGQVLDRVKNDLPELVKETQLRALKQSGIPEPKVQFYEKLNWKVNLFDRDSLILGDCIMMIHVDAERAYKTLIEKKDEVLSVLFPISDRHLISGTILEENVVFDVDELNSFFAQCSTDFFVSSEDSSEFNKLIDIIDKNSYLMNQNEIKDMFMELFGKYLR